MIPLDVIGQAVEEHRPTHVFAMFSGGHDSLTSTHIAAQHPEFRAAVHINTGIGIEETREFVRDTCHAQGWPLIELRTDPEVYRGEVLRHGFPAGVQQHSVMFRTLKERRVEQLVREHKLHRLDRIALIAGVRKQESLRRMGLAEASRRIGAQVWVNPIIDWSHDDKQDYMAVNRLPRNPVVDHLHMSGECLCGCYANMPNSGELDQIGFFYPAVRRQIEALEQEVFKAGKWPNWGAFRPGEFVDRGEAQPWLPLCASCPTRWETAMAADTRR